VNPPRGKEEHSAWVWKTEAGGWGAKEGGSSLLCTPPGNRTNRNQETGDECFFVVTR